MPGADDWRWRSGACIDRDSVGLWSDHRKPAWRKPPSLDGAVAAKIDGTVFDQPTRRLVRRSVVVGGDEAFQTSEELAAEHAAENLHRQEERIAGPYSAAVVRRQAARWNGAVNVRMEKQVLSPGMQNADHTEFRTKVFGIACYFQQCLCAGGEQQVVEHSRVVQRQHIEFVRHGEHDME